MLFILIGVVTAIVVFFYAFTQAADKETDVRSSSAGSQWPPSATSSASAFSSRLSART